MDCRVFTLVGLDEIDSVDVDCVGGWVVTTFTADVTFSTTVFCSVDCRICSMARLDETASVDVDGIGGWRRCFGGYRDHCFSWA